MEIHAYTDGSYCHVSEVGGYGFVLVIDLGDGAETIEEWGHIQAPCSTNKAELTAIQNALFEIWSNDEDNVVNLFTDSSYCLTCILNAKRWRREGWSHPDGGMRPNYELVDDIDKLIGKMKKKGLTLKLHKVKGHSGILHNERADCLAEWGRLRKEITP